MPWFKVDDNLADHPKVKRIPRAQRAPAIGLWTLAGSWSARHLRDGLIPDYMIEELASKQSSAEALATADLWHKAGHECDQCKAVPAGHFLFHDWASCQPTRVDVQAERDAAKERMRKARERKKAERSGDVRANESEHDSAFAERSGDVRSTPTRPDPTRPISTSVEVEKEGDRQAALPASDATTPPRFRQCPKHRGLPKAEIPPCDGCAAARADDDAANLSAVAAEQLTRRLAIDACSLCDDNGLTEDEKPARCSHPRSTNGTA